MNDKLGSIFCRSIGPGGTTVSFYLDKNAIKCIWTHENCPYGEANPITEEAYDGHNINYLPKNIINKFLKNNLSKSTYKQVKHELENENKDKGQK